MLALQSIVGGEEEEEETRSQRPEFITTPQLWCLTNSDYKRCCLVQWKSKSPKKSSMQPMPLEDPQVHEFFSSTFWKFIIPGNEVNVLGLTD